MSTTLQGDSSTAHTKSRDHSTWSQEQTPFQQTCIQEREQVKVELQRGARVAGMSQKVNGTSKTGVSRVYTMTVAPYSRLKKAKDLLRETAKPLTDFDYDLHIYQANCAAAADEDEDKDIEAADRTGLPNPGPNDERFWYRAERGKRFQVNKHFPALVSPRIVPTYRMRVQAQGGEDPSSRSAATGGANPLMKATAAAALRLTLKPPSFSEDEPPPLPFLPSGRSEASEVICNRTPTLFATPYDTIHELEVEEHMKAKSLFLGRPNMLATGGQARIRASCEAGRTEKDELIRRMREKGEAALRDMQKDHFTKLRSFQQEWKNIAPMPVLRQIARDEVFNMGGCRRFIS